MRGRAKLEVHCLGAQRADRRDLPVSSTRRNSLCSLASS